VLENQQCLMFQIPESPLWYVSQNRINDALSALKWLRIDEKSAEDELQLLVETQNLTKDHEQEEAQLPIEKFKQFARKLSRPDVYKPFLILLAYFFFQEGSGIYIYLFYSVDIFQYFSTEYNENVITITIGILRLIMSILGAFLMTKFGRRELSIFSGSCMSLSTLVICLYLFTIPLLNEPNHLIAVVCIFFHVGFSMTGFLQIPFILSNELFPVSCRGLMSGVSCSVGYVLIFISVKIYPDLLSCIGMQGVQWCFWAITTAGVVFLALFLPETKGKTFEQISSGFCREQNEVPKV